MDCQLFVYAYLSDCTLQDKKDTDCKDSCDMWSGSSDCFYVERNFWTGISFYRYFCDGGRGDCFYRILYEKEPHGVCYCMIVCVVLEVVLYVSSNFIHDYTRFNLYFLIDFVLTIVNMLLLPCTVWEVSRDDVY